MCKDYNSTLYKLFDDLTENKSKFIDMNNISKGDIEYWLNEYVKDYSKRLKEELYKI